MRLIAWIFIWAFSSAVFAQAGTVDFVRGPVSIAGSDGTARSAQPGTKIAAGESVETGAGGELHAIMADGGMLAVRPDSRIRIDAFRAEGNAGDESKITLLKGALRAVTGWLAKVDHKSYVILTPTATAGVRGTDFEVVHIDAGGADPAGTHVRVHDGAVALGNSGGEQIVNKGGAGHAPIGERPRLHAGIPDFIERRKGGFDERVGKHSGEINRHMEASLRQRGLLKEGESLEKHLERRRTEIARNVEKRGHEVERVNRKHKPEVRRP